VVHLVPNHLKICETTVMSIIPTLFPPKGTVAGSVGGDAGTPDVMLVARAPGTSERAHNVVVARWLLHAPVEYVH